MAKCPQCGSRRSHKIPGHRDTRLCKKCKLLYIGYNEPLHIRIAKALSTLRYIRSQQRMAAIQMGVIWK